MKIVEITSSEKFRNDNDYRDRLSIYIKGDNAFSLTFIDGEPEDANLSRDFNDCYSITTAMKLAYEAGKKGEDFTIEQIQGDDWEDFEI